MQSLITNTRPQEVFFACTPSRVSQSYSVCNWSEILPQGLVFGDYITMYNLPMNQIQYDKRLGKMRDLLVA